LVYFLVAVLLIASFNLGGFMNSSYFSGDSIGFFDDPESGSESIDFSLGTIFEKFYSGSAYYLLFPYKALGAFSLLLYGVAAISLYHYFKHYFKKSHLPVVLFIAGNSLVILWWPWRAVRYLLPLIPYFIFMFPLIYEFFMNRIDLLKDGRVHALVMVGLMVVSYGGIVMFNQSKMSLDNEWQEYVAVAEEMRGMDGNVMCRREPDFYLYSGLKSVSYPITTNEKLIEWVIEQNDVRFFVYDSFTWTTTTERYYGRVESEERIGKYCFSEFLKNGETVVYEIALC